MTEPIRPVRLADIIAERLQAMILEGVLRPGDRLNAERELAEALGVSRPSLREALSLLERKGLLVGGRSGTTVARFLDQVSDPLAALLGEDPRAAADYFEYRLTVEPPATALAARRASPPDRAAIARCLERMARAHGDDDPTDEADCDVMLHGLVYEAAHNLVLLHIMRALYEMLRGDAFYNRRELYAKSGSRDLLLDQHFAIAEAVLARNPEKAAAAATAHIKGIAQALKQMREEETRVARAMRRMGRSELLARTHP